MVARFHMDWKDWDMLHAVSYSSEGAMADVVDQCRLEGYPVGKIWDLFRWKLATPPAGTTMQEALSQIRKSLSKQLRRDLRRAYDLGEVRFTATGPESGIDSVRAALQEFYCLEVRGWKGRENVATLFHSDSLKYYDRLACLGKIVVHRYQLNSQTIGIRLGVIDGTDYFAKRTTYDENFSRLTPGQVLCLYAQCELADRGCTTYYLGESGYSLESFKHMWTDEGESARSRVLFRDTAFDRFVHCAIFIWLPFLANRFTKTPLIGRFRIHQAESDPGNLRGVSGTLESASSSN
jgi:hypothetical protein